MLAYITRKCRFISCTCACVREDMYQKK